MFIPYVQYQIYLQINKNWSIFIEYSFHTLTFLIVYHCVSFVVFWSYYYNVTHSLSIFFSESLTFVYIFNIKMKLLKEDLRKLSNGQTNPKKYLTYRTSFVKTLLYFFTINQVYGPIFLACFLVVGFLSIMITLYLVVFNRMKFEQFLFLLIVVIYTMLIIFGIHWHLAKCIRCIHRPGWWLFKLMTQINCKTGLIRVKIKLLIDLLTFNVLQTNRFYGFTYGHFGLISMMAFTKVCLKTSNCCLNTKLNKNIFVLI